MGQKAELEIIDLGMVYYSVSPDLLIVVFGPGLSPRADLIYIGEF